MKNTAYESESMQFLRTLLNKKGNREKQQQLRQTWWEKNYLEIEEENNLNKENLRQDGYVYFSYPHLK